MAELDSYIQWRSWGGCYLLYALLYAKLEIGRGLEGILIYDQYYLQIIIILLNILSCLQRPISCLHKKNLTCLIEENSSLQLSNVLYRSNKPTFLVAASQFVDLPDCTRPYCPIQSAASYNTHGNTTQCGRLLNMQLTNCCTGILHDGPTVS